MGAALLLICGALTDSARAQEATIQGVSTVRSEPAAPVAADAAPEPDPYRRGALYLAARSGDADRVEQLLREGAEIDAPNRAGLTPLHAAAAHGHVVVARLLLANCAERDARDFARRTPLYLAIAGGHTELVDLLLQDGADPVARRPLGTSALRAAERYRRVDLIDRLQQAEAPPTTAPGVDGAPASVATGPAETRPRGTEGTRRFVQEKLGELGYDPGPIDGQLGGKTLEAILAFQARIGQISSGPEVTRCLVDRLGVEAARRNTP